MNPAFLDQMSWEMAEVYGAITDQILINLARHFPFYDANDPLPSSAFEYQAAMLAQMGQVNAETVRIIKNGLADADEALKNTLEQAIIDSVRRTSPELWEGVKKGVLMPPTMPIVSPNQYRAFQLYYTQAADKLNLVNTVMLESTKSAYAQAITDVVSDIELADRLNRTQIALDAAAGETITGVSSWNQALRHATDKLKDGGITGFVDHAGHHWSAEAYTAMDIRTTTFNTGRAAVWELNQSFGNDLYIVSYHNGARPLCYPWQNKVISANNNAGVTYDLDGNEIEVIAQSATSYGEAAGLFGINCRHYPSPWIPGVSLADGKPQDKEDNDRVYAESQEQRRLERKLREEKRDLMMAKAQGRPQEELDRLQAKCRKSSEDIDTFCKETGRARHRDREAVYTKREFPDKEKYDVSKFEREQKAQIDQFYKNGGAQQNYTFGQLTPKTPIVPATPVPVKPTPTPTQPAPVPQTQNVAPQATPKKPERVKTDLENRLERSGIEKRSFSRYETTPIQEKIIMEISGGDRTKGSCASVGLAYAGNVNGLNVRDFRGGESQRIFSSVGTLKMIAQLDGVDGYVAEYGYELTTAHKMLKMVEPGKQYFFTAGKHAAIVKKEAEKMWYLELQHPVSFENGWHILDDSRLMARFGVSKSRQSMYDVLIDIDKLNGNEAFESVLEYINTAVDEQKKGVGGAVR